ncbi:hypothetical protein R4Z10_11465 [Niallia sp. XMNu-256]|uniref:hypothetical protein n=1 Tax=Niallia sp. XMNu-256 TaxID=3082444 RepID=UPI0030D6053B
MRKRKTWSMVLMTVTLMLLLAGCLGKPVAVPPSTSSGGEKQNENNQTSKEDPSKSKIPADEELFNIIEANTNAFNNNDLAGYMETIHSQSPIYNSTEADVKALMETYVFQVKVSDLKVIEKTEQQAIISFKQTTIQLEGPPTQNTETTGTHTLKPDNGKWKITSTTIDTTTYLDESGYPLDENTEAYGSADYKYRSTIEMLNFYLDERQWVENYYEEGEGTAIAEFMLAGETLDNWTELYTIQFFENSHSNVGIENYLRNFEQNIPSFVSGDYTFQVIESTSTDAIYEYTVTNDPVQPDMHEVARVFSYENHLFVLRYTKIGPPMREDYKNVWIQLLKDANMTTNAL